MSNTIGTLFRVTTWGESHGPALGVVIDGCPAGLELSEDEIRDQLRRDIPDPDIGTPRGELNRFQLLSGVFQGKTLGTPISIVIWNNDARPGSYETSRDTLRPGHADFTYLARFGHTDYRGGSRASGRECIARLAAGAVARKVAARAGVVFGGRVVELAGVPAGDDPEYRAAREKVLALGEQGDSTGGIVEITISGLRAGIGAPVFRKLQADMAQAFFSIGGVKGCEYGAGFGAARMTGSVHNDPFRFGEKGVETAGNRCGGLLGGISTGGDLVFRLAIKPTPTIALPQQTVNVAQRQELTATYEGRFDKNFAPRVGPIAEAMAAIVLVDHLLASGVLSPTHCG